MCHVQHCGRLALTVIAGRVGGARNLPHEAHAFASPRARPMRREMLSHERFTDLVLLACLAFLIALTGCRQQLLRSGEFGADVVLGRTIPGRSVSERRTGM
jgi:hypothetical protein